MKLQQRVYRILEDPHDESFAAWAVNGLLIAVIFLDLLCFALETSVSAGSAGRELTLRVQSVVLVAFSLEYVLRMWAAGGDERFRGLRGRLRFALRPFSIVDLLAILPLLTVVFGTALPLSARLTAVRAFRLIKLLRYSHATRVLLRSVLRLRRELGAFALLVVLLVVLAGIFIYEAEHGANPEEFPTVAASMWWALVTMTTVGYGDQVPVTEAGRVIGSIVMVCGIGMFALPAGLLGAAFTEESRRERDHRRRRRERRVKRLRSERLEEGVHVACPDCGLEFRPRGQDFR